MKVKVGDVVSLTGDRYGEILEIDTYINKILIYPVNHPEDEGTDEGPYWCFIEDVESIR